VACFASNIARVESVVEAAARNGRHVALVGRSMHKYTEAARAVGYLRDMPKLVSAEEAGFLPRDKVLYLCTGSQGEPRAALSRIANDDHPEAVLEEDDTVIFSSRVIPGNDIGIFELQNKLAERGIEIITDSDHFVHVSGHPCREELATMYSWVRPQISVPVHGETRHLLEHARFAKSLQVPEAHVARNGSMLRLAPGPARIVDQVPSGRLYLDGNLLVSSHDPALAVRRRMSFTGHVVVTLVLDRDGELIADAAIRLAGVPQETLTRDADFVSAMQGAAEDAVDRLSNRKVRDDAAVEDAVRKAVRPHIRRVWGKRPLLDIQVIRTD
jgi:ribonuclease J